MSDLQGVAPDSGVGGGIERVDLPDAPQEVRGPRQPKRHIGRRIALVVMAFLLLVPFVPLIFWSFSRRWFFPSLLPDELSDRAWSRIFDPSSGVMDALVESLIIATLVAVIAAVIGLSGGRALGLYRFRGKRFIELYLLAPVIVPSIAVAMGIQIIFIKAGIAGGIPGVVLVHLIPTIPYVVLVMGAVFSNYDTSYEEQAKVLGASPFRVFIHVTLPAVLPGLVVAAFFAFLISWSEYITTVLIGQGRVQTLPMLLFAFIRSDPSVAAALSLFFIAPAILLMFLTSRYLSGDQSAVGGLGRA